MPGWMKERFWMLSLPFTSFVDTQLPPVAAPTDGTFLLNSFFSRNGVVLLLITTIQSILRHWSAVIGSKSLGPGPSHEPLASSCGSTSRSDDWIFCPPEIRAFIHFAGPNVYSNYLQGQGRHFAANPSWFNYCNRLGGLAFCSSSVVGLLLVFGGCGVDVGLNLCNPHRAAPAQSLRVFGAVGLTCTPPHPKKKL